MTKPQTQRDERYNFIEEIGREYGIEFGDLIYTFHCGQLVNEEIPKAAFLFWRCEGACTRDFA